MGVVKKAFQAIGLASETPKIETNIPAQQLEREPETTAEDITLGQDEDTTAASRGKRGLIRPVASSLGV